MECPFRDFEFPDLELHEDGSAVQIEQIEAIVNLVLIQLQTDLELYPAIAGVLRLIDDLNTFLRAKEGECDRLREEYNKRRAFAESCGLTKAPSEDRKNEKTRR